MDTVPHRLEALFISARRAMSSAKINIESCKVPNFTPLPRPFIPVIRSFIKIQNNVGDKESP